METVYHRPVHSETGQTPLERFTAGAAGLRYAGAELHEAFLWSEHRTVTKTATVSLHSNTYEVDAALVGRKVELVFDPFDLTRIEVRWQGRPMGIAVPHKIGRHVHHAARPEPGGPTAPGTTGIDYLRLVEAQHTAELAQRTSYAGIAEPTARRARPRPADPARHRHHPDDRQRRRRRGGGAMIDRSCSPTTGSPRPRSARTSPRRCCTATAATPKPSPASAGASTERALGVVTGEVGAGKTVAVRAALAELDTSPPHVIYLGNPAVGARGLYHGIVTALGDVPRFHKAVAHPPNHRRCSPPRTTNAAVAS